MFVVHDAAATHQAAGRWRDVSITELLSPVIITFWVYKVKAKTLYKLAFSTQQVLVLEIIPLSMGYLDK